jgi:twitching motility protein PilT
LSERLNKLLIELTDKDGSDLHIKSGQPPIMRIRGDLVRSETPALSDDETQELLFGILNKARRDHFNSFKEVDLSYTVPNVARFRVNMFWQMRKPGAVFRAIPFKVRTCDQLGLPPAAKKLSMLPRGLILVTGPTGSGKSTSLAGMINEINITKKSHIMTVEDPIEYVHADKQSIVNQRELSTDTHSFADALKHVMRQNPDVILVGEMRDLETIQLAITAAETGHLVMSTLHTVDAAQTMDRMIDVFPPEQQAQIRTQLSVTIQGVLSQTLIPSRDGKGRVAAFEVMVATPAIRTLIREGKTHQLYLDIQTGADLGMQTLDGHLLQLVREGKIDFDHAIAKSSNAVDFQKRAASQGLTGGSSVAAY